MPDSNAESTPEYLKQKPISDGGLNADQKKALKTFRDAKRATENFCKPYFDKFIRFDRLRAGVMPPELDGTYSKIMLQIAFAMIQNEIPRSTRPLLSTTEWFKVTAQSPEREDQSQKTQRYLRYQMETVQRIASRIIPSLQSAHAFGTGYRVYGHRIVTKKSRSRGPEGYEMGIPYGMKEEQYDIKKTVISGDYLGIYDYWPFPGGGVINSFDDSSFAVSDGGIRWDYMTEEQIKAEAENGNFDKQQVAILLAKKPGSSSDPTEQYKQHEHVGGDQGYQSIPDYMRQMNQNEGLPHRRQVGWLYKHDHWICVAEDCAVLYNDKPLLDWIPIAKFTSAFDLNNFFGKGLIELTEDIIISTLLTICHRFDYLAGTLHPPTWIKEAIFEHLGNDTNKLDGGPFAKIPFPNSISDIRTAVLHDAFPQITPQAFMESQELDGWLQKITGQTNYGQGIAQPGGMNQNATGFMAFLGEGAAQSMLRAVTMEETGLLDSLYLTLKLSSEFFTGEEFVRTEALGPKAHPWETMSWEELNDEYGIEVQGSRSMTMMQETFRRMVESATTAINVAGTWGPQVLQDPQEFLRQILMAGGAFQDVNKIVGTPMSSPPMGMLPPGQAQGQQQPGMIGQPELANQMQAMSANQPQIPSTAPVV